MVNYMEELSVTEADNLKKQLLHYSDRHVFYR